MNDKGNSSMGRSALLLAVVAVLGSALLASVHALTKARIEAQERRVVLEQLHQVMPADRYDNALHEDFVLVDAPESFAGVSPVTVYRARRGSEPSGVVMRVTAPDGYNGDIGLLVGIDSQGVITGVRVTGHRETPGLGDPIELRRSDWIRSFEGRSLDDPQPDGWAVRRDGGVFDQFTGATITPRAVVAAVERSLVYFRDHRDGLFQAPASGEHGAQP